jgi:hypothetical protein
MDSLNHYGSSSDEEDINTTHTFTSTSKAMVVNTAPDTGFDVSIE